LQADVQKAYAEGLGNMGPAISSGGSSNVFGNMVELGVGLAAANTIAPQISGMMQGFNPRMKPESQVANSNTWNCSCGNNGIVGNFCNMCGSKRPVQNNTWNCSCGNTGIIGNFCNMCGSKKPEPENNTWDCSCGNTGIIGNFCNNCGKRRGE
jgi:hypothetical protein